MTRKLSAAMCLPVGLAAITLSALAGEPPVPGAQSEPNGPSPEAMARMGGGGDRGGRSEDFPKFEDVSKDYVKVVSTADGDASLYTLYTRQKDGQVLAELPRNFDQQKILIAYTVASGITESGVQTGDMFVYWKRYDKQLALMEPNIGVRSTGDLESNKGRDRVFTDRVVLTVPIACLGPGGGPVVDMDNLLVGQSSQFFGNLTRGANPGLTTITKAKAYPKNVELGFNLPLNGGQLGTIYYSISVLPENTGYQPRVADTRVGYFTTVHRDLGNAAADTPWVRYVNRWKLEKADPKLSLSPPKEPIVFYLEDTIPVRYRRWVREGVLEWNKAFEKIGIANAIEVYQQDARTGAHMDKDPEDARYNFVMWTNAGMGFAIGPSRVDPRTGQILDADIVMDEGFITSWANQWKKVVPQQLMQSFGPETFDWLAAHPDWDPRVLMAEPAERRGVMNELALDRLQNVDETGLMSAGVDGIRGRTPQESITCMNAMAKSLDVALFRLDPMLFEEIAERGNPPAPAPGGAPGSGDGKPPKPEGDVLDGVPEWFIGPLLRDVIMHECGHTLGLRHNFKASSVHSMKEINSAEFKGQAQTGSVMDYNPININFGDGPVQGDYTMMTIGPYDYWAIQYGYTSDNDLKPILSRVSEDGLSYATDEDARGPDPLVRTFDFSANSLDYCDSQMRLVKDLRGKILDRLVKDGDSWAKARQGYDLLLGRQSGAIGIAGAWLGGANVNRDKKGDPGNRNPVTPVSVDQQRRAIKFIVDNAFSDDAFGLTPELLSKMTVDKWADQGGMVELRQDATYPIHDRIMGIQASALTMIFNPTTLNRVFDNETRVPDTEDALTLPEVVFGVTDAVWSELEQAPSSACTARKPMISSLRRNLQREHLDRMIDMTMPTSRLGASTNAIANLCAYKLRELSGKIEKATKAAGSKLDPYTLAHLAEAKVRIDKALDAQVVYNMTAGGGGGGFPGIFFGQPVGQTPSN